MLTAEQALFAMNHCSKYDGHDLLNFLRLSHTSEHVILNDCCLVQYDMRNDEAYISFIMFDSDKCDFKLSTYKNIRDWFSVFSNTLMFEPLPQFKKILGIK